MNRTNINPQKFSASICWRPPEKPFILAVLPLLENGPPGGSFLLQKFAVRHSAYTACYLWYFAKRLSRQRNRKKKKTKNNWIRIFFLLQKVLKFHFYFLFRHEKERLLFVQQQISKSIFGLRSIFYLFLSHIV